MTEPAIGNTQRQLLDALTVLTTPTMMVEDPNRLRDQFAMAALPALIATYPTTTTPISEYASTAYRIADAMLEKRKK